ncbi:MAG: T9SS type B sorting domain-containing protein, partial [Flavobacteriales bacterium]
ILPGPFSTESVELCPGDSYTFQDGTTQNNIQSNLVYLSVFPQTSGCDSIVETVVNVSFSQGIRFSYSPNPIGPFDFDTRLSVLNPESSNYDWSIFDSDSLLVYSASDSAFDYQFENIAQNFTVCVSAVTSAGCTDTTCQEVPVTAELTVYIPNAFTPEIDGKEDRINDIFLPIIGGAIVENYNLNIYDRWGKRLFVSDDVLVGWDGRFKERPIPSDVYVYNLTFTTKGLSFLHQYRGTITIVK